MVLNGVKVNGQNKSFTQWLIKFVTGRMFKTQTHHMFGNLLMSEKRRRSVITNEI